MSIFGPTPPQIWGYSPRRIPSVLPHFLTFSGDGLIELTNAYLLKPIVSSDAATTQTINSATGIANVETERLNLTWWTSIWGPGRLLGYRFVQAIMREYIDSVTDTYRYRTYVRPCVLSDAGVVTNLDAEQLVGDHTHPQAGTAGWYEDTANVAIRRPGLDVAFNGLLGFRFRTTSWTTDGAGASGCGVGGINVHQNWLITLDYVME